MNFKFLIYFFLIIFFFNSYNVIGFEIKIIGKVNNTIITNVDIENEKKYLLLINKELNNLSDEELNELAINSYIREVIKNSHNEKNFQIEKLNGLQEDLFRKSYLNLGFENRDQFIKFLGGKGLNFNFFKKKILNERLWNQFIFDNFNKKINIDDQILKEKLNKFINNLEKKYEYDISEILVEHTVDEKEILNFIDSNNFETAANKYSISNTSLNNGRIGWVKQTMLSNEINMILSKLNVSEISKVIRVSNGKLILKLNNKKEINQKIDLDKELELQKNYIRNQQLNIYSQNYFKKIKQNSIIDVY